MVSFLCFLAELMKGEFRGDLN